MDDERPRSSAPPPMSVTEARTRFAKRNQHPPTSPPPPPPVIRPAAVLPRSNKENGVHVVVEDASPQVPAQPPSAIAHHIPLPPGLRNIGNTCFANAISHVWTSHLFYCISLVIFAQLAELRPTSAVYITPVCSISLATSRSLS